MNYLSVCSGIEAASVAWHPLGWRPVAFSEMAPFPSAVLRERWPDVPNLGDMTQHRTWNKYAIRTLVGGTPCQDFSVAGLRAGLGGARGSLTLTFLELVQRLGPEWVVWENVPGTFSAAGNPLGALLFRLSELGYGWAYRVLDAQYWGVAQRRRRIIVVGCARGAWQRAGAVLFDPSSLRGDSPPGRAEGEDFARTLTPSFGSGGPDHKDTQARCLIPEIADCLQERDAKGSDSNTKNGHLLPVPLSYRTTPNDGAYDQGDKVAALSTNTDRSSHVIVDPQWRVRRLTPREFERLQGFQDDYTRIRYKGKPVEGCPDGPRYRALGNSMAVPVMQWLGRRIDLIDRLAP